jgi:hypothetical protein
MGKWVAIAGVKYSGKDSFGDFFVQKGYTKINFADNLKHLCASVFAKNIDLFYDSKLKEVDFDTPVIVATSHIDAINEWVHKTHTFSVEGKHVGKFLKSPREILQYVGTEILRDAYPDYHTEATMLEMAKYHLMICSDIRFPNERDIMDKKAKELKHQFMAFYIRRPGFLGDSHASETSVQSTDMGIIIENNTDLDGLQKLASVFLPE